MACVAFFIALIILASNISAHVPRIKQRTTIKYNTWIFSKGCVGLKCDCWAEGCFQNIGACFGFDCYDWQCHGARCECPIGHKCLIGCLGLNCNWQVVSNNRLPQGRWEWSPLNLR